MANMKQSWKETGSGLGGAFKHLGKTLINTGKTGVDKAVNWAQREDTPQTAQQTLQPVAESAAAEPAAAEDANDAMIADEIRKLADMKNEGILTEEEFTAKKRLLLGL